jgi:phosphate transport system substrate-binding protein
MQKEFRMKNGLRAVMTVAWVALGLSVAAIAAEELLGAGATFPYPLYSKMFFEYNQKYGVKVNYQAIGSGGGILQVENRTVDFGASDAFIPDSELARMGRKIIHVPTCAGAVAITYNLPKKPVLNLPPEVLTAIFMGKITKWNDPKITQHNPGIALPNQNIVVVYRSDGSGTTYILTQYLAQVSNMWKTAVGAGKSVRWPVGVGAKGNAGVAALVGQIPGSVGYIETIYARQNTMPMGRLRNKVGVFVAPDFAAISAAADAPDVPEDTRTLLINSAAKNSYPIVGLTWIVVDQEQNFKNRSRARALATAKLIQWMVTGGQTYARELGFAPLSADMQKKALTNLKKISYNGQPLL